MNRSKLRVLIILKIAFRLSSLYTPAIGQLKYIIDHYNSMRTGSPANGITGIEVDKQNGYLWVGTQGGLVRFDGRHFTSFASNRNVPANSRVAVMVRNREGRIFVGDDNFSVNRIDKDQPVFMLMDTFFIPPFRPGDGKFKVWPPETIVEKVRSLDPSSFFPAWVIFQ